MAYAHNYINALVKCYLFQREYVYMKIEDEDLYEDRYEMIWDCETDFIVQRYSICQYWYGGWKLLWTTCIIIYINIWCNEDDIVKYPR